MKYIKSYSEFILEDIDSSPFDLSENDILIPEKGKEVSNFKNFKEAELKKASKNKVNQPVGTAEIPKVKKTKKQEGNPILIDKKA